MNEIWKNIDGFENLYQVSSLGRVKSLKYNKERILKPGNNGKGYLWVQLWREGKVTQCYIHRLVAQTFIENPDNLPQVNHINEDKTDNRVNNLEWCSIVYNLNYGTHNERIATALSKPIYSVNKTTNEITYYQSISDAERVANIAHQNICSCLKGKLKSAGGRYWYYAS